MKIPHANKYTCNNNRASLLRQEPTHQPASTNNPPGRENFQLPQGAVIVGISLVFLMAMALLVK